MMGGGLAGGGSLIAGPNSFVGGRRGRSGDRPDVLPSDETGGANLTGKSTLDESKVLNCRTHCRMSISTANPLSPLQASATRPTTIITTITITIITTARPLLRLRPALPIKRPPQPVPLVAAAALSSSAASRACPR